jgi:predicted flavoprotein YhiN
LNVIAESVCKSHFQVSGKSTFKEEFVTAGGVALNEVDFRTMESKIHAGLYFAGEILDIDGVTGGFNFQAAWTTAFIAAKSICNSMYKNSGEIDH